MQRPMASPTSRSVTQGPPLTRAVEPVAGPPQLSSCEGSLPAPAQGNASTRVHE